MKKTILITIIALLLTIGTAQAGFFDWIKSFYNNNLGTAVRVFTTGQGGTNISSTTISNEGKYLKVSSTTPNLIYSFDTPAGGTGLTSLNGQTGGTQTFSTSTDTNIQLRIVSSANDHQFTPVWAGTLADSRITSAATWNAKITTTSLSVAYPPLAFNNTTGVFSLPTSTASQSGFLSSADWTTFNGKQNNISWPIGVASTSLTGGAGLTLTTNDMACDTASGSVFGCLASVDWTTFNNKQGSLTFPLAYASTTHLTATSPLLITAGDLSLTGRLATINNIATTTGNLLVAKTDTTGWYSLGVGANGKVLTASSTATNGISWETIVASASAGGANTQVQVNENGAIAGYSGLTFASSTGLLTVGSSTISGNFKLSSLLNGFLKVDGTGLVSTSSIDISSDTNLAAGRSLTMSGDSVEADAELFTKDLSISFINATTTTNGSIQKQSFQAITITEITCSTNGANITIGLDERASSTPQTAGTDIFNGGSMICVSGQIATSTFANATIAAGALISLDVDSVANATSTLRIHINYQVSD